MKAIALVIICGLALLASIKANAELQAAKAAPRVNLNSAIYYTQSNSSSFNEMIALPNERWTQNTQESFNLGYSEKTYWLKVTLDSINDTERYLVEVKNPVIDNLTIFIVQNDKVAAQYFLGDKQPFNMRPITHPHFVFPLPDLSQPTTIYVHVDTSSSMQVPLFMWSEVAFYRADQTRQLIIGIYFGLMGIMAVYNLLLYASIKDNTLLFYVAYVSSMTLFYLSLSGVGFQYFWPNSLWWNDQSIVIFLLCSILFGVLFIIQLLDLKTTRKYLFYGCKAIFCCALLVLFLSAFLNYSSVIQITIYLAVFACVWGVSCGATRLVDGSTLAIYYTIAWGAALGGGVILAANKFTLIDRTWFSEHALLIGTSIEVACLSFAIAERIRFEKRKRYDVQNRLVATQKIQNEQLELQVKNRTHELQKVVSQLELANNTDHLTQIANRRKFNQSLTEECARAIRFKHPLSLLLIDIDFFKLINDEHGHQVGDNCLVHIATLLTQCCDFAGDMVARYGGEEFCILLPELTSTDAFEMAQNVRSAIQNTPYHTPKITIPMTVSIGVYTSIDTHAYPDKLIQYADAALYDAKKLGRNRVNRYGDSIRQQ